MKNKLTDKGKRDLDLIKRALESGDTTAYNELMRLYRDPIYFMLYEKIGDQELIASNYSELENKEYVFGLSYLFNFETSLLGEDKKE